MLLFLAVLILPTLAIVAQGWMIASRDREIAESRSRERVLDIRRRLAAEVGQDMFALLERIKGQEVANAAGLIIPQPGTYSDPAVVLVGRTNGKEILWPWNTQSFADAHRQRMQDPPFAQMVEDARRAELAERDHKLVADLYGALIGAARTNGQRAYARLGMARALRQSGASAEAIAIFRKVLNTPSNVVDQDNVSFPSLAATELTKMHAASADQISPEGNRQRQRRDDQEHLDTRTRRRQRGWIGLLATADVSAARRDARHLFHRRGWDWLGYCAPDTVSGRTATPQIRLVVSFLDDEGLAGSVEAVAAANPE